MVWTFDEYVLDFARRELYRGASRIELEPQTFDILAYLVRNHDRVVAKDELFQAIWRGRIVSDSALTTRVNAVRRAVGDDGKKQRLIRTLPRRGLRFVGEVVETASPPAAAIRGSQSVPRDKLAAPMLAVRPAVAVSPFVAIGETPEEKSFARGLFESVLTALNHFRWICVVAADGTGRADIDSGARYIVKGAVHRDGERLRVTARLVGDSGLLLWSDRFDGVLADGFDLQDWISATVVGGIEPAVQTAEAQRYNATPNRNATPHELHLRAQPIFSNGRDNVVRSLRLLERAIALDPNYGPALADAAFCLQILDINGWSEDRLQMRQRALEYARKALQVSSDAEPVATAAHVFAYFGEEMEAALALTDQATALNPYSGRGWYANGMARLYAGQLHEAARRFETSSRLNPRDHVGRRSLAGLGILALFEGRFEEAIAKLRQTVQEYPQWATPYCALASSYAHLGLAEEAAAVIRRLKVADPSISPTVSQFRNERQRELLAVGLKLMDA